MPSQHKTSTVSVRLPDADREALKAYAERQGITVHAAILRAIREKLARDAGALPGSVSA